MGLNGTGQNLTASSFQDCIHDAVTSFPGLTWENKLLYVVVDRNESNRLPPIRRLARRIGRLIRTGLWAPSG
jgi:hypothetical protein